MIHQYDTFTGTSMAGQVDSIFSYWDKNMICRFANEQFNKWFRKKTAELIGVITLKELLGNNYDLHFPFLKKVFEGKTQVYEYEMYYSNGKQQVTAFYYPEMQNGRFSGLLLHITLSNSNPSQGFKGYKRNGIDELKSSQHFASTNYKMQQVALLLKTQLLSGFPSIEYLAKTHLISISKLMRDFKSTFHTTPFIYYRTLQMGFAAQYIQETGCSKKQIALMLGFSNPGNFTSCFNKWVKEQRPKKLDHNISIDSATYHKWFISQLPIAVAMIDSAFNYLAVSNQWLMYFDLSDVDIIKKNFFDFFTNQKSKWKEVIKQCLNGEIKSCEEDWFETINGKKIMFKWDMKPWFDDQKIIGGIFICIYKMQKVVNEHKQLYFEHQ